MDTEDRTPQDDKNIQDIEKAVKKRVELEASSYPDGDKSRTNGNPSSDYIRRSCE